MGLLNFLAKTFLDGGNNRLEKGQGNQPERERRRMKSPASAYDRDFEFRLLRARTEPLTVERYCDEDHSSALVHNDESGNTYLVTETSCECEDFRKKGKPCKHMIFLAMQNGSHRKYEILPQCQFHSGKNDNGEFVPLYWEYYSVMSLGLGYTNLFQYEVSGRIYGTSEKTGKQTNRKKTIMVNARSLEDAKAAAAELGVMPPYAGVEFVDTSPSYEQFNYLHGAGIPAPYFICALDMSALLTRYEDGDNEKCPEYLFEMATRYRVRVSYFQSPASVKSCIWSNLQENTKTAIYCYAVYCRERGYEFGDAPIRYDDPIFTGFLPSEKEADYIRNYQEFGWRTLAKNASAYISAKAFLQASRVL